MYLQELNCKVLLQCWVFSLNNFFTILPLKTIFYVWYLRLSLHDFSQKWLDTCDGSLTQYLWGISHLLLVTNLSVSTYEGYLTQYLWGIFHSVLVRDLSFSPCEASFTQYLRAIFHSVLVRDFSLSTYEESLTQYLWGISHSVLVRDLSLSTYEESLLQYLRGIFHLESTPNYFQGKILWKNITTINLDKRTTSRVLFIWFSVHSITWRICITVLCISRFCLDSESST